MKKRNVIVASALVMSLGLLMTSCGKDGNQKETTDTVTENEATVGESSVLSSPENFKFDPMTGEFSFTATDERAAYYFVRIYKMEDNVPANEYMAASSRIAGGKTGEITGKIDLPAMGWGTFQISLNSYPAADSGNERAEAVTQTARYGVGLTLERPEMLAMVSGNQVELIIDWYTLSDYYDYEYLPDMKFTFYADAECTEEVRSETVDLQELAATVYSHPVGWNWGSSYSEPMPRYYHSDGELTGFGPYVGDSDYCFLYDIYPYTLDAGTYYVTCQAISKLDYTNDSQVSTVVEITLTDEEPSENYTTAKTELWTDPAMSDIPSTKAAAHADRVDFCGDQPISSEIDQ